MGGEDGFTDVVDWRDYADVAWAMSQRGREALKLN